MIDKIINWTSLICSVALVLLFCMIPFVTHLDTLAPYFLGFGALGVIASTIRIKRA